jgi:hypothetical protein
MEIELNINYATEADVISALELIFVQENMETASSDFREIYESLLFCNMACTLETDKIILTGSQLDMAAIILSYIYTPDKLIIYQEKKESCFSNGLGLLEKAKQLLSGYISRQPACLYGKKNSPELEFGTFDVVVASCFDEEREKQEICRKDVIPYNRYLLETGIEFERCKNSIINAGNWLKEEGRLIVLTKPAWILKLWNLLSDLGLQLEYDSYRLYTGTNKHPNVFIWLRFIKIKENFNEELQKKNILALMNDNDIDRLYAHRNLLRFPYAELSYTNSQGYINLEQNQEYMQYFFSHETTKELAMLCEDYTACLVTPSVAQYAYRSNKDIVLFERDNRFRENKGLNYVKYDLNKGLTKFMQNKYSHKFDRVICDPPFDIRLDLLAYDIYELLKRNEKSAVYIIFPESRKVSLFKEMQKRGLSYVPESENITIEYAKPPKIVRVNGKRAIQLYKFAF